MKIRLLVRLGLVLILATAIPACHHHARKSGPPPAQEPDKSDPNAPEQKP
jgi:hypothetical protein